MCITPSTVCIDIFLKLCIFFNNGFSHVQMFINPEKSTFNATSAYIQWVTHLIVLY